MFSETIKNCAAIHSLCKAKLKMLIDLIGSGPQLLPVIEKKPLLEEIKVTVDLLICVCGCLLVNHTHLPLYKYSSLNGMDNAAEAWFLFITSQHQAHLAGKGGGQPVSHL